MIMVQSGILNKAAELLEESPEPDLPMELAERGVFVTAKQLRTAARLLRESEPSIITSASGSFKGSIGTPEERPGWINAEEQEDPEVLLFTIGILPSTTHRIDREGNEIVR